MTPPKLKSQQRDIYEAARAVREKAYSPYSGKKVGAAIRTKDGKIYTGCNVENSSYGATLCAERVAILKAVSEQGVFEIVEVMVVTDANPPWPPCGMCRQVMSEFADDPPVHIANLDTEITTMSFQDIFPHPFTPAWLKVGKPL